MTDKPIAYAVDQIDAAISPMTDEEWRLIVAAELTELERLNLKVAAIAGWEDIEIWNPKLDRKTFVGKNKNFPQLGIFAPDYTSNLNAIVAVFMHFDLLPELISQKAQLFRGEVEWAAVHKAPLTSGWIRTADANPAIALCKLLIELAPAPQTQIADDEPTVIEATFV